MFSVIAELEQIILIYSQMTKFRKKLLMELNRQFQLYVFALPIASSVFICTDFS